MNRIDLIAGTYLIVIFTDQLPIILSVRSPGAVVYIVVQRKITEARLLVSAAIHCLPWDRCLSGIKVYPDEAYFVDVGVDLEEVVGILVKVLQLLELGGFGKLAVKAIGPS